MRPAKGKRSTFDESLTRRMKTTEAMPRNPDGRLPQAGDLLLIDEQTSVQFGTPFRVRVVRPLPGLVTSGWCWLQAYVLDPLDYAVDHRELFLQIEQLCYLDPPQQRTAAARRS